MLSAHQFSLGDNIRTNGCVTFNRLYFHYILKIREIYLKHEELLSKIYSLFPHNQTQLGSFLKNTNIVNFFSNHTLNKIKDWALVQSASCWTLVF